MGALAGVIGVGGCFFQDGVRSDHFSRYQVSTDAEMSLIAVFFLMPYDTPNLLTEDHCVALVHDPPATLAVGNPRFSDETLDRDKRDRPLGPTPAFRDSDRPPGAHIKDGGTTTFQDATPSGALSTNHCAQEFRTRSEI